MRLLVFLTWFTSYIVGWKYPSLYGNPGSQEPLILWRKKGCLLQTGHSWAASGQASVLCFSNWTEELIPGKQPQSAPFCSSRSRVAPSNTQTGKKISTGCKWKLTCFHHNPSSALGILHYCRESLVEIYFLPHPADWAGSPFSSNPCFLSIILMGRGPGEREQLLSIQYMQKEKVTSVEAAGSIQNLPESTSNKSKRVNSLGFWCTLAGTYTYW